MSTANENDTLIDRLPEVGERWGSYVLDERIASGGMADVFRARRVGAASFSRQVCLKRMHAHLGLEPEMVTLFLDEALIGSKLRHRNIVAVEDLGEHEGRFFLAMEYVNGVDLRAIQKRAKESARCVPVEAVAYIANELLSALHATHTAIDPDTKRSLQVVHRDVSPQNVLVAYSGQVKLADFGVARAEGRRRVTESRAVCGKIGYMPLEQASGVVVDARADLFALGVTLFELLTGRRPFTTEQNRPTREQVLAAMMNDQRPRLRDLRPDVSPAFESLIDAMLVVAPQRRLPSALVGLELLDRVTERLRGGRILVEWLATLFPGQSSVATLSRNALAIPAALPTPRPGAHASAAVTLIEAPASPSPEHVVEPTRQIRRRAHVMLADGPIASGTAKPATALPRADVLNPASITGVETRSLAPASNHTQTAAALLFAAVASCVLTIALLARFSAPRSGVAPREVVRAVERKNVVASIAPVVASVSAPVVAPLAPSPVEIARPTIARSSRTHVTRHGESSRVHPFAAPMMTSVSVAAMAARSGSLRVVVLPWGDVEVDGERRGRAPIVLDLPAGMHRVRVTGAVNRIDQVDVRAGQTTVLHVDES